MLAKEVQAKKKQNNIGSRKLSDQSGSQIQDNQNVFEYLKNSLEKPLCFLNINIKTLDRVSTKAGSHF